MPRRRRGRREGRASSWRRRAAGEGRARGGRGGFHVASGAGRRRPVRVRRPHEPRPGGVHDHSPGRGPLSRFWLGSVATELVQCSPGPVLLVRPKEGPPDLAADPARRHFLIPLDGSPLGTGRPRRHGRRGGDGGGVRLLRVVPPVLSGGGGGLGELGAGTPTVADRRRTEASRCLGVLTARAPARRRRDPRRGGLAAGRRSSWPTRTQTAST